VTVNVDLFPAELLRLLTVAQQELDRHVNDRGRCRACLMTFPSERAFLADLTLSAF